MTGEGFIDFEKSPRILPSLVFLCRPPAVYKIWIDPPCPLQEVLLDPLHCKTLISPLIEKCLTRMTTLNSH